MTLNTIRLPQKEILTLSFLLDMKFGSIDQIGRFCWGGPRYNYNYTSDRLTRLKDAGYVQSQFITIGMHRRRYFTPTLRAYHAIHSLNPDLLLCRPISGIQMKTFRHDNYVNECRIVIESKNDRNYHWRSERILESEFLRSNRTKGQLKRRRRTRFPDAIYQSSSGYVYFELENSYKSKSRYIAKLEKYRDLFEVSGSSIAGVLWVTVSQTSNTRLWKALHDLGLHHHPKFSVVKYEDLKKGLVPYE